MKPAKRKHIYLLLLPVLLLVTGCGKQSYYYPEEDGGGLSIFSNKGFNVFTCLLDGRGWKTVDRDYGRRGSGSEFDIKKQFPGGDYEQLVLTWTGGYMNDPNQYESIRLVLSLPAGFGMMEVNALSGKRIALDGVNSYISYEAPSGAPSVQGPGTVFFQTMAVSQQLSDGNYTLKTAGLLEASLDSLQLTSGRFDHKYSTGTPPF